MGTLDPLVHKLLLLPDPGPQEDIQLLLQHPAARIERIVSDGQVSPPGFWYDQMEDEWVVILQGAGSLEYADGRRVDLCAGECLLIPAHCRHRVVHTAPRTVWLAVFLTVEQRGERG